MGTILSQPGVLCPLCGETNNCAIAGSEGSGSSCWCMTEEFPAGLVESIPSESQGTVCICRRCVIKARRVTAQAKPLLEPGVGDFYQEGRLIVFTEAYHRRRGYCCGSGCRHCPFEGLERELACPGNEDRKTRQISS